MKEKLAEVLFYCFFVLMAMEFLITLALRAFNNIYNMWIHRHDEQYEDDPSEGEEHTQP